MRRGDISFIARETILFTVLGIVLGLITVLGIGKTAASTLTACIVTLTHKIWMLKSNFKLVVRKFVRCFFSK